MLSLKKKKHFEIYINENLSSNNKQHLVFFKTIL